MSSPFTLRRCQYLSLCLSPSKIIRFCSFYSSPRYCSNRTQLQAIRLSASQLLLLRASCSPCTFLLQNYVRDCFSRLSSSASCSIIFLAKSYLWTMLPSSYRQSCLSCLFSSLKVSILLQRREMAYLLFFLQASYSSLSAVRRCSQCSSCLCFELFLSYRLFTSSSCFCYSWRQSCSFSARSASISLTLLSCKMALQILTYFLVPFYSFSILDSCSFLASLFISFQSSFIFQADISTSSTGQCDLFLTSEAQILKRQSSAWQSSLTSVRCLSLEARSLVQSVRLAMVSLYMMAFCLKLSSLLASSCSFSSISLLTCAFSFSKDSHFYLAVCSSLEDSSRGATFRLSYYSSLRQPLLSCFTLPMALSKESSQSLLLFSSSLRPTLSFVSNTIYSLRDMNISSISSAMNSVDLNTLSCLEAEGSFSEYSSSGDSAISERQLLRRLVFLLSPSALWNCWQSLTTLVRISKIFSTSLFKVTMVIFKFSTSSQLFLMISLSCSRSFQNRNSIPTLMLSKLSSYLWLRSEDWSLREFSSLHLYHSISQACLCSDSFRKCWLLSRFSFIRASSLECCSLMLQMALSFSPRSFSSLVAWLPSTAVRSCSSSRRALRCLLSMSSSSLLCSQNSFSEARMAYSCSLAQQSLHLYSYSLILEVTDLQTMSFSYMSILSSSCLQRSYRWMSSSVRDSILQFLSASSCSKLFSSILRSSEMI